MVTNPQSIDKEPLTTGTNFTRHGRRVKRCSCCFRGTTRIRSGEHRKRLAFRTRPDSTPDYPLAAEARSISFSRCHRRGRDSFRRRVVRGNVRITVQASGPDAGSFLRPFRVEQVSVPSAVIDRFEHGGYGQIVFFCDLLRRLRFRADCIPIKNLGSHVAALYPKLFVIGPWPRLKELVLDLNQHVVLSQGYSTVTLFQTAASEHAPRGPRAIPRLGSEQFFPNEMN